MRRKTMVFLYLPQQTNTCSKTATKTLEITGDNSNENLFKNQPSDVFYKKKCSYLVKFVGRNLCQSLFFNKVASLRPATLLKRDSGKGIFLWILRNFLEHLFRRALPGDCFCYSLNLSFQFVTINITFSLLRVFTQAHALMSLNFCVDLLFGRVILSHALQDRF